MRISLFFGAALAAHSCIAAADTPGDPVNLEHILVSASPLERDQTRLAMATTVLNGDALAQRLQPSLGETLALLPGISSTYFGPGASRPVIRGLGGDRIRVLQNSVGTFDASVISPDHAVSLDPLLIEKIEIIRGPAALLFGGNAIGGAINVIDHRIHHRTIEDPLHVRAETRLSSVDRGDAQVAVAEGAAGPLSWHVDGFRRSTDDVSIPGYAWSSRRRAEALASAESRGEVYLPVEGTLPNSATRTDGAAAGISYGGDRGFLGLSISGYNTLYGIPPTADETVRIDLRQRKLDLQGELKDPLPGFRLAKVKVGFARYRHQELEGHEVGTLFQNRGYDSRLELVQQEQGPWSGAVGAQVGTSRFSALGEEAFLPPSNTRQYGVFAFEELVRGTITYQLGARIDQQRLSLDQLERARRDTAASFSLGAIWALNSDWSLSGTFARNERPPNVQELFADGPHVGTQAFERGRPDLRRERSTAAEVVLRRRAGRLTGELSFFAHRFDGYISPFYTGVADPETALPIYEYAQRDAEFYGAEVDLLVHLHAFGAHVFDLQLTADTVRAKERVTDENLPRITPRRATASLRYRLHGLTAALTGVAVEAARHLATGEDPTPGYTQLNAAIAYERETAAGTWSLFLQGDNLTNQTARNHVSFLKDLAPLPGRNLTVGVRYTF